MFALVTAIYGSFLVIYTSTNAINMVLNSMSLYFIMELDVMMVDQSDYASMCTLNHTDPVMGLIIVGLRWDL